MKKFIIALLIMLPVLTACLQANEAIEIYRESGNIQYVPQDDDYCGEGCVIWSGNGRMYMERPDDNVYYPEGTDFQHGLDPAEEAAVKEAIRQDQENLKTDAENFITMTSPKNEASFHEEPVEFSGLVPAHTERIVVTASGGQKGAGIDFMGTPYYQDVYTLTDFKPGDTTFTYRAAMDWNNLTHGSNDYEFEAFYDDGSSESANLTIFFQPSVAEMGKPVIYLYPEETMAVSVNVEPDGGISVSEPDYGDGWSVVATPDSRIYDLGDGEVYPYLFWEGFSSTFESPDEGFVVALENVDGFFDEKLAVLGLNEVEINDFKEFWVPYLNEDPFYFITFVPQDDFDEYAPLTVSPAPDSVIRVMFDYKGLSEDVEVVEQDLVTPERNGFTVVEWGGRIYR